MAGLKENWIVAPGANVTIGLVQLWVVPAKGLSQVQGNVGMLNGKAAFMLSTIVIGPVKLPGPVFSIVITNGQRQFTPSAVHVGWAGAFVSLRLLVAADGGGCNTESGTQRGGVPNVPGGQAAATGAGKKITRHRCESHW